MVDYDLWDEYCRCCNPGDPLQFMTPDEYYEMEYHMAAQAAEIEAENAWLRAAEAPTLDDMAFEQWERDRGCY